MSESNNRALRSLVDKPFLELSVYQSKSTRANIMQFKNVQLLVQEFAVKIDQGLIMAMLLFFKPTDVKRPFVRFLSIFFSVPRRTQLQRSI